jgi:glycosyltransferase involved in cell wall biosynthesis
VNAALAPRLLMVAYHFPPLAGSSGIQRTLRFVQHLPATGWQPLVLTAAPRAYEQTSPDLLADIPPGVPVRRAFALDTSRHLAIAGRHLGAWARPDRWVSWRFDGVRQGLAMVAQHAPAALWSTYPIPTAHLIAAALARRTGLPWIADFRDPMAQDGYPSDPRTWAAFKAVEETAFRDAAACVFTTPGAARLYRERYPALAHKVHVIENGYDEESFAGTGAPPAPAAGAGGARPFVLLHSGIVYPSERDPRALFAALGRLKDEGALGPDGAPRIVVRFRAAVHEAMLAALAQQHGVAAHVEIAPALPYRAALAEMLGAEALLLLQAANCNDQVPAKLYEYLRARRPIVALTDPRGDTAAVLRGAGIHRVAPLDDAGAIAGFLADAARGTGPALVATEDAIAGASRAGRARALAALLGDVVARGAVAPRPAARAA